MRRMRVYRWNAVGFATLSTLVEITEPSHPAWIASANAPLLLLVVAVLWLLVDGVDRLRDAVERAARESMDREVRRHADAPRPPNSVAELLRLRALREGR